MKLSNRLFATLVFAAVFAPFQVAAQTTATSKTRPHVVALASDKLEGRLAGTAGERLAADYLVAQLKRIGARPLPGADFRLPFEFTAGTKDGGATLGLTCSDKEVAPGVLSRCGGKLGAGAIGTLSFSDDGEVSG